MDRGQRKINVSEDADLYKELGYNESQATTLAWVNYYEKFIKAYKDKGIDCSYKFHTSCFECDVHKKFAGLEAVRAFVQTHKNHNTWIKKV